MTHDELVQFAAEKVGGEVCNPTGDELCVKTLFTTLDPTTCSGWHIHDLTSPDLFFEGLAVCPHQVCVKVDHDVNQRYVFVMPDKGKFDMRFYDKPSEIPQKFWECWAEVEGGK